MEWSKYNFLYKSDLHDFLLYNSFSNSFFEINEDTYNKIINIRDNINTFDFTEEPALFMIFKKNGIITDYSSEQIDELKLNYNAMRFSKNVLNLTIAPTRDCNFICPYCYEESRPAVYMDENTIQGTINFIKNMTTNNKVNICWYGGEPLMAFETIEKITKALKKSDIKLKASMVTNGYLLNEEICKKLDPLNISNLQITIDGPEETHNKTRIHKKDKNTFKTIISNIKTLFQHWNKSLNIRVNLNKENQKNYPEIYQYLKNKFPDKNLKIYAAPIQDYSSCSYSNDCTLNSKDMSEFSIKAYKEFKIKDRSFFPKKTKICAAENINGFLIDPVGDLYKCWHNMGDKNWKLGSIFMNRPLNKNVLLKYLSANDVFDDEKCRKCFFLPLCLGGCINNRMLMKDPKIKVDNCIEFKHGLKEFLDIHYILKKENKKA